MPSHGSAIEWASGGEGEANPVDENDIGGHDKDAKGLLRGHDDGLEDVDAKLSLPLPEDGAGKDDWGEKMAVPQPALALSRLMASRGIKALATRRTMCWG